MNRSTPRFLLGALIIFWGFLTQQLWVALVLSPIIEFARFKKLVFHMAPQDFNKFVDISTVLMAGSVVYALTVDAHHTLSLILKWLPIMLFPVIAAQEYSHSGRIDLRSFFLTIRKKADQQFYDSITINISFIYAAIVLFSAASSTLYQPVFYSGTCFFTVWALFSVRPSRYSAIVIIICLILITGSGYMVHKKIRSTGTKVTQWIMSRYYHGYAADPFRAHTAIGEIGRLKLSNNIILRARFFSKKKTSPFLLHQASFNRFTMSTWFTNAQFSNVPYNESQGVWEINRLTQEYPMLKKEEIVTPDQFRENLPGIEQMKIYLKPTKDKAVLALPRGVFTLAQPKAESCEINNFQTVRVKDPSSLITSLVFFNKQFSFNSEPSEDDLSIHKKERQGLMQFVEENKLNDIPKEELPNYLKHLFARNFNYSLELKGKGLKKTALENFLLNTRSGHCELFATATVLILRQAGIPARYATGFIVHETSPFNNYMVVRNRDAHAWVEVYLNGKWENLDTTPPSLLTIDADSVQPFWLEDLFSAIGFSFFRLRHETGKALLENYGLWLILPLAGLLFFRLRAKGDIRRTKIEQGNKKKETSPDKEPFLKLEQTLNKKGFKRIDCETLTTWLHRINPRLDSQNLSALLEKIIQLRYIQRFNKNGLTQFQQSQLIDKINQFTIEFERSIEHSV